jgi:hypothetical protein
MDLSHITTNWKTSLPGGVLIILGLVEATTGITIPGFTMPAGAAITAGIMGLMAKDANITGGTVKQ